MSISLSILDLGICANAAIDVQIGTANRAGGDFDNGVTWMFNLGIGNLVTTDVPFAAPHQRFHEGYSRPTGDVANVQRRSEFALIKDYSTLLCAVADRSFARA
jgi:hypothetical protein